MTYPWPIGMTGKAIRGAATDGGVPINLTGMTVRLGIKLPDGTTVSRVPTVLDAAAGTWEYYPVVADVGTVGVRSLQLHLWDGDGKLVSCPQGEVVKLKVWSGVPVESPEEEEEEPG